MRGRNRTADDDAHYQQMALAENTVLHTGTRRAGRRLASLGWADLLAPLAYVSVFALTVVTAYWALFSQFVPWDDEGFFEHGILLVIHGHAPYSSFFTDYGPFTYVVWGLIFRILGKTITTDSGRLIQVFVWSLSSLALGLASHRLARSLAVGISVQALSFTTLWTMMNEPMAPGGTIVLLLSLIVFVVAFGLERRPELSLFAIGALVACIILSKINQGGYAFAALVFATVMGHPSLRGRVLLRRIVEVGFVALAPVIMLSNLGQDWTQRYAAVAIGGMLALTLVASGAPLSVRAPELRRFVASWAGGIVAAGLLIVLVVLALGATLGALFDDIVIRASDTSAFLTVAPVIDNVPVFVALGGVAIAYGLRRSGALAFDVSAAGLFSGAARLVVGVLIWLTVANGNPPPNASFAIATALAWVAAVPSRLTVRHPWSQFGRLFVTALALTESLDAYPVAGSQVPFSGVLFLVCGAICVADGFADLKAWGKMRTGRGEIRPVVAQLLSPCFAALALGLVLADVEQPLKGYEAVYKANTPLAFGGATRLRLPVPLASTFDQLVPFLKASCRNLFLEPGLYSFSDWSGVPVPDGLTLEENGEASMSYAEKLQALRIARAAPGLCVLQNPTIGIPAPTPLVRYVSQDFRPIASVGGFTVEARKTKTHHAGSRSHRRHGHRATHHG